MKKNLNIAYLNGAEGMIRRGGASSGGSGESGGDSGNGSNWRYYDISKYEDRINIVLLSPMVVKDSAGICPVADLRGDFSRVTAIGVDIKVKVLSIDNGDIVSTEEIFEMDGITDETLAAQNIFPITKEQFYSLE